MDGFNVIAVEKDSAKVPTQITPVDFGVELIDEEKVKNEQKAAEKTGGLVLFISIIYLFCVLGYLFFLVFYRISSANQIIVYAEQMNGIAKSIDLKEIQEYQIMDKTLQSINGKLKMHVLTSEVIALINENLRKNLQISEYRLDVKQTEVEVSLSAIAPSFKELAEQTEKLYSLKEQMFIKSFTVSSLSFEPETKKVKFSVRIIFDRAKTNAFAISQTTNI